MKISVNPLLLETWHHLYSGDKLAVNSIRGLFEYKSCLWCVHSGVFGPDNLIEVHATEVVPKSDWKGKTTTYAEACSGIHTQKGALTGKKFTYHKMLITLYGHQYVMTDTEVYFVAGNDKPLPKWEDIDFRPIRWAHTHECPFCKGRVLCDERKADGSGEICLIQGARVCKSCLAKKTKEDGATGYVVKPDRVPLRHVLTEIKKRMGRR